MMGEDWNKVICIDTWAPDESFYEKGYYPEGARDKAVYTSPADVGATPLRPNWRYLLKRSRSWAPWQFWMEVMAYRIGQVMGAPVPPAYVGLTNVEKPGEAVYGALIEWFYGPDEGYVVGSLLIGPTIPGFDYDKGTQHNLQSILDWFLPPDGRRPKVCADVLGPSADFRRCDRQHRSPSGELGDRSSRIGRV